MRNDKTKQGIIKELRETLEESAHAFVLSKKAEERSTVFNVETEEFFGYLLPPKNALKAAYVAHILRRVGRIHDIEFVVLYSASDEFAYLDDKIVADGDFLRLGGLCTHLTPEGKVAIDDMFEEHKEVYKILTDM